jgi:hypothetical protein
MKYIIEKSDLFIDNKLYSEGTEIELSEDQTKGIEEFLQPCHPEPNEVSPELVSGSIEASKTKTNTKGNKK